MTRKRPPIPPEVALSLRKESGFGCCKCGCPIIQYHHIIPWEKEKHFRVKDMMCLCPNHHTEATENAMLEMEQRKYKNHPFNIINRNSKGLLKINQKALVVSLGSIFFVGNGDLIKVDNETLVSVKINEFGTLNLSLILYDNNQNKLVEIKENEWLSVYPFPWDIRSKHQILEIRSKKGDINLLINAKKFPISISGSLWYKNQKIKLSKNNITFDNLLTVSNLAFVGACFNIDTIKKQTIISGNTTNKKFIIVSKGNIKNRIDNAIKAWINLKI